MKARELDRAIGQWWFGPTAGTFYVFDLRDDSIEAGESGMSLDDLVAWFARSDRRAEPMRNSEAAPDRNSRLDRPSVRARATM
ncbi:MAG: hypothetical protein KJO13_10160 [Gammaproteobacteria bacterium]|nr:hypothetical protein [Gammaproteobacteria bacterium]